MQERQVTVGRVRHKLSDPFFVLATQNPIEQEGTYPLPEAQQDRFMFKVFVKYPSFSEEFEIARRTTAIGSEEPTPVLRRRADSGTATPGAQSAGDRSRDPLHAGSGSANAHREPGTPKFIREWLSWGAVRVRCRTSSSAPSPRCYCTARAHVQDEDIQALAMPVLRHRILTNFTAASEGVTTDTVIKKLLEETPSREGELQKDERFKKILLRESERSASESSDAAFPFGPTGLRG